MVESPYKHNPQKNPQLPQVSMDHTREASTFVRVVVYSCVRADKTTSWQTCGQQLLTSAGSVPISSTDLHLVQRAPVPLKKTGWRELVFIWVWSYWVRQKHSHFFTDHYLHEYLQGPPHIPGCSTSLTSYLIHPFILRPSPGHENPEMPPDLDACQELKGGPGIGINSEGLYRAWCSSDCVQQLQS